MCKLYKQITFLGLNQINADYVFIYIEKDLAVYG